MVWRVLVRESTYGRKKGICVLVGGVGRGRVFGFVRGRVLFHGPRHLGAREFSGA